MRDPDALKRLINDMSQEEWNRLFGEDVQRHVDSLPDAELTLGPMTRLATDGDFMLDEMGIRPEGYESGN